MKEKSLPEGTPCAIITGQVCETCGGECQREAEFYKEKK